MSKIMASIGDCPYGLEDGSILSYATREDKLLVEYEFWNDKRGVFRFDGFLALRDHVALGSTIGGGGACSQSALIDVAVAQVFSQPPKETGLIAYAFVDVDGATVLEVVATGCGFQELTRS